MKPRKRRACRNCQRGGDAELQSKQQNRGKAREHDGFNVERANGGSETQGAIHHFAFSYA
jgi:hypothetical protein